MGISDNFECKWPTNFFATNSWRWRVVFFLNVSAVGAAISLFDHHPVKVGNMDFNISMLCCGGVLLLAVAYYASVLSSGGLSNPTPFRNYVGLQLSCATVSVSYWYFSGMRTGLFVRKS